MRRVSIGARRLDSKAKDQEEEDVEEGVGEVVGEEEEVEETGRVCIFINVHVCAVLIIGCRVYRPKETLEVWGRG